MQAVRSRVVRFATVAVILGLVALLIRTRDSGTDSEALVRPGEVDERERSAPQKQDVEPNAPVADNLGPARLSRPVGLNPEIDVPDGFRGEVHPLLHGTTALEVTAHWTPIGTGLDRLDQSVPPVVYRLFQDLTVASERRTCTEREFSAFLPDRVESVGQIWSLDPEGVIRILRQFHDKPSLELVATGRRGGPNGAFAVLRARNSSYLDIAFRIHAEFDLTPDVWRSPVPLSGAWYTPGSLEGRLIVNLQTGTADYFLLELPPDKSLNVHLTVAHPLGDNHDIVHVDRMDLSGGDPRLPEEIAWTEQMTITQARDALKRVFYRFENIDWVPVQQALAVARERQKPIVAMVMWGALDDQSC